ncbi:MAG: glutamate racemase [Clostridiales bacterium]|nr:glutamate racemase [Clostridiales bacterium]
MKDLIGFFDSGVGGISVLHTAMTLMPRESFLYYGDNGNAPYGTKPLEEIRALCRQAMDVLLSRDVKAIVLACNTATSAYAEILRSEVSIPVIGMEPAIKPAQENRTGGDVLALATKATLSLPKFKNLMARYGSHVIPVVGEGFVELVESGEADSERAREAVEAVLAPYMGRDIDSIVLGCTHYPFLQRHIQACFPGKPIFDGRLGTAMQLRRRLEAVGSLSQAERGTLELRTSGATDVLVLMRSLLAYLDRT